jgi:hypothetical protein
MAIGIALGIVISSPLLGPLRSLVGGINATFAFLLAWTFTPLALALLPILRPRLYDSIKFNIKGVPVPAFIGAVGFALGVYFFATNAQSLGPLDIGITCFVIGLGMILYIYYSYECQKMGVDLKTLVFHS